MTAAINSDLWSLHVPPPPGEGAFGRALWQAMPIVPFSVLPSPGRKLLTLPLLAAEEKRPAWATLPASAPLPPGLARLPCVHPEPHLTAPHLRQLSS